MPVASRSGQGADERVKVIQTSDLNAVNYDWGAIKWICDRKVTPGSMQSFGYAFLMPGKTNPEHRHRSCEEIIYMLAGELKVYAMGECITLKPGQTAYIPKGVRHSVVNEGWEPVVYIASFSAAMRDTVFKGQTGPLEAFEPLY
jgi:quercetin dioxygenase-like cupin family protein